MSRFVLLVDIAPPFSIVGLPITGLVGSPYSYAFTAYGAIGTITWKMDPETPLPVGWTLSDSGLLEHSDPLTTVETIDLIVTATDQSFTTMSQKFSLEIVEPLP